MGLDRRRAVPAARLDHVGVERALHQEARVAERSRLLLEHADELLADDLALALGLRGTREPPQEAVLGVDRHQRHVEGVPECGHHLVALVLAHQPVVDEHAGELVAHGLVRQERRHGRIDAAGQPADHPLGAHLLANLRDPALRDRLRRPRHVASADVL